jgi:glycosyltransferase involved in cell wall biosynthesis
MNPAPIVLFVYNRLWHTQQTVEALQNNVLAKQSELYIYSDGANTEKVQKSVNEVRQYIDKIDGFKSVTIIKRIKNFGLAESIIDGVTTIVNQYGRIIVLEDDMVVSPYFLEYMNETLEQFVDDERVISVHGYVYPVNIELPEAFFLTGADCWGWATWRRGWALFNSEGQYLLDELVRRHLIQEFDYNGAYPFLNMLKDQIKGANDSWAIRWNASAFLAGKLTLYPGRSLVHNIGTDSSGTHCKDSDSMDAKLSETKINLNNISVESSRTAREAFENFFRQSQKRLLHRLLGKAGCLFRKK